MIYNVECAIDVAINRFSIKAVSMAMTESVRIILLARLPWEWTERSRLHAIDAFIRHPRGHI